MIKIAKMTGVHRIHCLGIGGAGMSGIAEILRARGYQVTGSELAPSHATSRLAQLGIPISFQTDSGFVSQSDFLVYSSAIPLSHPEWQYAKRKKIPYLSRGQMLGVLLEGNAGIAVAGTHGKTSTVGLIAQLLQQYRLDPTVVIGGYLNRIKSHATFGKGEYFVTEADESDGSLLFLKSKIAVLTQIDKDHLVHYNYDFSRLVTAYHQFIEQTQNVAILSQDDPILANMIKSGLSVPVLSYGFKDSAMICGIQFEQFSSHFRLTVSRERLHQSPLKVTVPLLGKHNAYNVLAAVAVATHLRIPDHIIQAGLKSYQGVARRLESLGEVVLPQGAVEVLDDYGHHPREIAATAQAIRAAFPGRRLVLIFQPHRYTRTRDLLSDFAEVLAHAADCLLLLPIYAAHEPPIFGVDHFVLEAAIRQKGGQPILVESTTLNERLNQCLEKDDIVLFQGAGNIGQMAKDFQITCMKLEESFQRQYP